MTTGISSTDCGHSGDTTCTQRNGGGANGSRWCASETGGCCLRVQPPAKNQFGCCTSLDVHNFYDCGNSWCPWSDDCKGILNDYCASTDNIAGPVCQLFCSKVENKALCDPTMRKYCETVAAPGDPLCACIRSDKDGIPAPSCFSAPCTSGGYQTLDHVNQATRCPDFCGAIIDCASTEGCEINDNSFETYCCQRHPDLCKNNGGGGGGDSFWSRFVQFWTANTQRKIIGGGILVLAIVMLVVLGSVNLF
jgi:hypothetical protein